MRILFWVIIAIMILSGCVLEPTELTETTQSHPRKRPLIYDPRRIDAGLQPGAEDGDTIIVTYQKEK